MTARRLRYPDNTSRVADPEGAQRALDAVRRYAEAATEDGDPEVVNRILRAWSAFLARANVTNYELPGMAWSDVYAARMRQLERARAITGVRLNPPVDGAQTPRGTTVIIPWGALGDQTDAGRWSPPGEHADSSGRPWALRWRDGTPASWPPWDWLCGAHTARVRGGARPGEEPTITDRVNHVALPWWWGVLRLREVLAMPDWRDARSAVRLTVLAQALHNAASAAALTRAVADGTVLVDDRQRVAQVAAQLGLDGQRAANAVLARYDRTLGGYLNSTERSALDAERARRDELERSAVGRAALGELQRFAATGTINPGKLGTAAGVDRRSPDLAQLGQGVTRSLEAFRALSNPRATQGQTRDAARAAWQSMSTVLHAVPLVGTLFDLLGAILNELPMARGGDERVDGPWGVPAITIGTPGGDPAPGSVSTTASLIYSIPRNRRTVPAGM